MFPPGFLGTRADILMDIVVLSFIVILPLLAWSWLIVRRDKKYSLHKRVQLTTGIVLAVVVALFEYDLKVSGGIFELTSGSSLAGTTLLNAVIYTHTLFAVAAALIWVGLIVMSLIRFDSPPKPGAFSRKHRFWGRAGMVSMMLAAATAPPLYYLGFVL